MKEYEKENVERLRREMFSGLGEEEGKFQCFCVMIGRKPETQNKKLYPYEWK